MKVPKKVIGKISLILKKAVAPYQKEMKAKHAAMLPDVLLALAKSSSCYVSQTARNVRKWGGSVWARERKLLRFIHSPKIDLDALRQAHLSRIPMYVKRSRNLRIFADISDITKPYARKMDALDIVRDASDPEEKLGPGYWINEVYVNTSRGRLFPAVFDVFSTQEKGFRSQTDLVLGSMEDVYAKTNDKGTWISDMGYDNKRFFDRLLSHKRDFIIRITRNRKMIDEQGHRRWVLDIVGDMKLTARLGEFTGDPDQRARFGYVRVTFPHRKTLVTLVVFWDRQLTPVMLLTSKPVSTLNDAVEVIKDYLDRWLGCEDPVRFLKQAFHLEKFLVDGIKGIRFWVFLIQLVFSLLFEIESSRKILRWVLKLAEPFRKDVRFAYYRILSGLSELLQIYFGTISSALCRGMPP